MGAETDEREPMRTPPRCRKPNEKYDTQRIRLRRRGETFFVRNVNLCARRPAKLIGHDEESEFPVGLVVVRGTARIVRTVFAVDARRRDGRSRRP